MNKAVKIVAAVALITCMTLASACSRDPNVRKQKYLESGQRYVEQGKYNEAVIQFASAIKVDPAFGVAHYELAKAFIKLRNGNAAYAELLRTVDLQPDNMKAQVDLADVLLAAHKYNEASERADIVLEKEPDNTDALMIKALALSGQGDQAGALASLKRAIVLAPSDARLFNNLGAVQVANNDFTGAEASFKKAVELDPKSSALALVLARLYQRQNRASDAEAQFQRAVQLSPESAQNRRELAKFYSRQGQLAAAERVVSQAKNDLRNDPEAYAMLGDFYFDTGQTQKATAEYAEVFEAHKGDISLQKAYIRSLMSDNRVDDAERLTKEILKKNPKDVDALGYQGQILLWRGQAADAIPIFETVLKSDPDNVLTHYYFGQALAATGNSERAAAEWGQAIRLQPNFGSANQRLAEIAVSKNDAAGARRYGEALIASQPKSAIGYLYVAAAYVLQKQPKAADTYFAKALEVEPGSAVANAKFGAWKMKQGLSSDAEKMFEQALATDPNSIEALSRLVALYRSKKQNETAIARVRTQINKAPQNSVYHQLLGELLIGQNDLPGAEAELKKAVELPNPTPDAILALANVQGVLGKTDDALRGFQHFSALAPKDARGYFFQGFFQAARGNFTEAEELYRKALAIEPENPQVANNLARLLLKVGGNTDVALSLAQTARRRAPDSPDAADTLAWAYYHKGVYGSARHLLEEVVKKRPDDPTYHFHLGRCYASMNDKSKARAELQRALQLDPKFPEAEEARKAMAQLN